MGEFELIRTYFLPLAQAAPKGALVLGLGDDCAVQRLPAGRDLVFSIDTMVEGIHFPESYPPDYLGWRALAAAASDLAAMGAEPACFTLALTLPEANDQWLARFARGLADAGSAFGLALAGGDTTRGGLALSIQVHGTVTQGLALTRSGANPGDLVCVSGTLGDAGAALEYLDVTAPTEVERELLERYHHPQPRLALGQALAGLATAAIDISDGLVADLQHLLDASEVGATIDSARLPLSSALKTLTGERALQFALHSGDDYELCLTLPEQALRAAPEAIRDQLTVIGVIDSQTGVRWSDESLSASVAETGFDHFRSRP